MRRSSQSLAGGFALIAVGLIFYAALVLLQVAGNQIPVTFGPLSLFILVALFFFAHAWSMRKSEQILSPGATLPPPPIR
jgi:lipopolysaccharide export LptBFGC system permease protein LptF